MPKTCLVCNMINMEMISIFRHTKKLDKILKLLLDLQATQDDHLCRNCCDEVIKVFDSKQQKSQCDAVPNVESDLDVIIELESDNEMKEYFEILSQDVKADKCSQQVSDRNVKTNPKDSEKLDSKNSGKLQEDCNVFDVVDSGELSQLSKGGDTKSRAKARENFQSKKSDKLEEGIDISNVDTNIQEISDFDKNKNLENISETDNSVQISSTSESNEHQMASPVLLKQQIFPDATELKKHTRVSRCGNLYTCHLCSKTYKHKRNLNRHICEAAIQKCPHCSKTYKSKKYFNKHIGIVHTEINMYKCSECGTACRSLNMLKDHKMIHTGEKPYECSECKKQFRTNDFLNNHKKTHERPFQCNYCIKRFGRLCSLETHLLRYHSTTENSTTHYENLYKYVCPFCSKTYQNLRKFNKHMRVIHDEFNIYTCSECGAIFSSPNMLKDHKITHNGERPFECSTCRKRFRTNEVLRRHKRLHETSM